MTTAKQEKTIVIPPPNFGRAAFEIKGTEVLVIKRFSAKTKERLKEIMEDGKPASSKKKREPKNTDDSFNEARYVSPGGWDGFHAAALRKAMISACRLVNFKMVLAKLSVFVEADGHDEKEPQIPLIRIRGCKPVKQEDRALTSTGQPYINVRPAYHNWSAIVNIRWDMDQFTTNDIANLLSRVGQQVGLCEGRPDSKNSAGMGWGLFELASTKGVRK
jgi:hypothetical protein